MKTKQQKEHFKSLWYSMEAHFLAFYDTQDAEELHQMRVQVKKIKAILDQLTDVSDHKKTSRYLKKLMEIFRLAGKLRSVHVNLEVMENLNISNDDFITQQQEILANETSLLYARHDEYLKSLKKAFKTFSKQFDDIRDKKIFALFEKQINALDKYFNSEWTFDLQLHEARKRIKELLYLHQVLNEKQTQIFSINKEYLHDLQDIIGKWHDHLLTLQLIDDQFSVHTDVIDQLAEQISQFEADISSMTQNFKQKTALSYLKPEKKKKDSSEKKDTIKQEEKSEESEVAEEKVKTKKEKKHKEEKKDKKEKDKDNEKVKNKDKKKKESAEKAN
jgi:CHAD domain-containing protein